MGLGKGSGRGGRRPGAGRPKKPRPAIAEFAPAICEALSGIRTLIEAQGAEIARLRQQRRDAIEHGPMILRRLVELERLVRADPGFAKPQRHTRARPLGVD